MADEYSTENRRMTNPRLGIDYARGILFFALGIVLFFKQSLGDARYIFGGLFVVYGIWRFYSTFRRNKRIKEDA
jgi:hypothetical protein